MALSKITIDEYDEKIANETAVVLLDFWKEGCGPCKALMPEVEAVLEANPQYKGYSVNIEEDEELVSKFRVMAAPTLLVIKDGAVKKKSLGYKSKESILEMIEKSVGQ